MPSLLGDNEIWKAWQAAKQKTIKEGWAKENSRAHWHAIIEEAKAECAWMIESFRLEMTACEATKIVNRLELLESAVLALQKPL